MRQARRSASTAACAYCGTGGAITRCREAGDGRGDDDRLWSIAGGGRQRRAPDGDPAGQRRDDVDVYQLDERLTRRFDDLELGRTWGASGAASVDSIKAQGFAEQVVQRSRGAVTEFRVVTTNGPSTDNCVTAKSSMQQSSQMNSSSSQTASFDGKASGSARSSDGSSLSAQQAVAARSNASDNMSASQQARGTVESSKCEPLYAVTIEAKIAKFKAPADSKKIKIVVAPVRFDATTFVVGNNTVPAATVAQDIHQQILDALANTGRFSVLDREFGSDVQQELDMIATGQAPSAEIAKLGQAMTADVIWVGRISSLAYNRHARRLQTSDRELVSYSGGWAMSQRIVIPQPGR